MNQPALSPAKSSTASICEIIIVDMHALDWNLLPVLRALLEEVSVTKAARRVQLSQSATSAALARLRRSLGDELLIRSGRGLTLSPRARALRQSLPSTLDSLREQLLRLQRADSMEVRKRPASTPLKPAG